MDRASESESNTKTRVTAIVVNYRTADLTIRCLQALAGARTATIVMQTLVVDGASQDGSAERLATFIEDEDHGNWISLIPLEINGGFGWANNQAIQIALASSSPPEFVFLINPDAIVDSDSLTELVNALKATPGAGAAGSLLLDDKQEPLGSSFLFPSPLTEFLRGANTALLEHAFAKTRPKVTAHGVKKCDWVTGASVLLRSSTLRETGLFDEGFFLYFEEVELMHRMGSAGWSVIHVPASKVEHIGGAATGVGNGLQAPRRLPQYWYRSRMRFMTLAHGRLGAAFATFAWFMGLFIWKARCVVGLGRHSAHAPFEARDMLRYGFVGNTADTVRAVPAWDSRRTALPAWMDPVAQ